MSASKKLVWDRSFSIGNTTIDDEHIKMVQIYNELIDLVDSDIYDRKIFAGILSKLTDFSRFHFKKEEEYMQNISYPLFEEHKKLHKDYIIQVAFFNSELMTHNPPNPNEILEFVENWLNSHIFKEDVKYEQYKKDNNINIEY